MNFCIQSRVSSIHYYSFFRQRSGRGGVLGCPVADNDAAVGDAGPVPAFPKLGVLAPMLEEDVADAWRVIREGVGDLGRRREAAIETGEEECSAAEQLPLVLLLPDPGESERQSRQAGSHLLPCGIIPLLDGHRWRLEGGQDDVVGRGQLYPDVIGAAAVCSGGKPREDRAEGGYPCFRRLALGTAPICKYPSVHDC